MSAKRVEEINLSDPRIMAAMKVLGITAENLRPREVSTNSNGKGTSEARETMAKIRFERNEAMRQRWLKEVKDAAQAINEAHVDALMGTSTSLPSQTMHFDAISQERLEKQREKLEEQRMRNKVEIQRALEEQMNFEQKAEADKKREEEKRKRLLELQKDQKAKLQCQVEKRKERTSKNHENLMHIAQAAREKMRELDIKLKSTCKVAWEKAQSARIGDEKKRKERRDHMDAIHIARDHEDEVQHTKRMEAYKAQITKEHLLEERLQERKEEQVQRAETARARFAEKIRTLHEEQAEEDLKKYNKGFKDLHEKLDSGKARAEELKKAKISVLVEARTGRHEKAHQNHEAHTQAAQEQIKKTRRRLRDAVDFSAAARARNQNETRYKVEEGLDIINELVQTTKERIYLTDDHKRDQAISRLQANTARSMAYQEEKANLAQQRRAIQKENMINKSTLRIALGKVRDTSPKKVNELLKSLDLPPLKSEDSKEETEGETQK